MELLYNIKNYFMYIKFLKNLKDVDSYFSHYD